jgi:hypothetical protein
MTVDAVQAGLAVEEVALPLSHRATLRDPRGFAHRGLQLLDALAASGPLRENHRGNRIPLLGPLVPAAGFGAPGRLALPAGTVAAIGLIDDLFAGEERGFRAHLRAGTTTGVLKLVAVPAVGVVATRSLAGGLLVGLAANALNQLDTKPGRALKAFLLGAAALREPTLRRYVGLAVLLLPYDLRERGMLGDSGSNALGAVLGLGFVARLDRRGRWTAVGLLAGLNLLGDRVSLGRLIERTPGLSAFDLSGRVAQ